MVDVSSGRKVRKQFLPALNRPERNFFNTTLEDVYREKYGGRMPLLTENVASGISTGLKAIGVPKYRAEDVGRRITHLAEDWTPLGALPAVERGGLIGTGLGVLAAVPIVGGKAGKVAKAVEEVLPEAKGLLTNLGAVRQERKVAAETAKIKDVVANFEGDALKRGAEYHKAGKLPVAIGTRMIPPRGSGDIAPWKVTGHYVDPSNPNRYGYHLKDQVTGDTRIEIANDPRLGVKKLIGWKPMGGMKAVEEILPEPGGLLARTTSHPISGVKLTTPIEEMEKTTVPFGKMREEKLLHPEWLLGKTVVPMRGDPAAAGQTLTALGGRKLETPVDLWGGEGYPRMEENIRRGLGWASQPTPAATQANRAAEIFRNTGKDVVGVYQKMGGRSTAFNTMLADTLHQMYKLDRSKIAQADVDEFDRLMREVPMDVNKKTGKADFPAYSDWPGLDNLTPEYIRRGAGPKGDGKVRNKMFKLMDSKRWQDRGFPNTGYANWATTDPKLLDRPTHTFGGATVTYDPLGRTVDASGHPTYSRGIVAKEEGVLPEIPLDVMDPAYRLTGGTGGGPIPNTQLEKFLMTRPPLIKVDDQTLDRIMKYLRSQEGFKWGLGGAIAAGIISEEQAREITQAQGTGAQL